MAKPLKLRLGVADDPAALQPSLNDCLEAMLAQAEPLMAEVIEGLVQATASTAPRRIAGFYQGPIKGGVELLQARADAVRATFREELSRLVFHGGGKETVQTEALRFEDLRLFEDSDLDHSIEVARAQQEVALAVDDTLPALDALLSTMLGWRTIQPGLNPMRPDVFVRALQATLAQHVPDPQLRETLITPAAGLLGVHLRKLYRELSEWLRSTGVEPAVPLGGRVQKGGAATGVAVTDSVAKTLLTLDKLRKLLAGDFDQPRKADFLHTVPASMALLQDMKQVDHLVKRLEQRPKPTPAPAAAPVDMLVDVPEGAPQRIGEQLGEEVVRLMFDNLTHDARLLPGFKRQLKRLEPAILGLAQQDSRFFSDRNHVGRLLLDRLTQRSLAFAAETDEGFLRFLASVESSIEWLDSRPVDAEVVGELLDRLHAQWNGQDEGLRHRREEAARALLHAEQRNLLAQKLAAEFVHAVEGLDVADFVVDFLRNSWAQVVAEAQLSCVDGSTDPYGYRAMVDDLIWSVQKSSSQRGRAKRLVQMIPPLLTKLREGLDRIGYPVELTQRFFDHLMTLHHDAVQEGRDRALRNAAEEAWAEESRFSDSGHDEAEPWLDPNEVQDSGFVEDDSLDPARVASPAAVQEELEAEARLQAAREAEAREREERLRAEREEAARREAAAQAQAREEAARAEAARQEQARQEAARQEAARQEAARQQAAREEAARQEAARQEAARLEAARQEEARREAARLEAERQEAARQELARLEAAREQALREGQAREEAARLEAERQELARREAERQEAARQEIARQEAAWREKVRQEEARREAERQEAARQEAARIEAARQEAERQEAERREAARLQAEREAAAAAAAAAAAQEAEAEAASPTPGAPAVGPAPGEELRTGAWVELQVKGRWVRAQLTWCSPQATLFMFTSIAGTAHSMSRRTLDKLRAEGLLKVVADRPVVEEALDQVARAALQNSLAGDKS